MPRKSAVSELQTEEVATESPVRRSSRIVNGNGTPAGISTRRTSQTLDSETPARATRSRRTSTQSLDENLENKTSELKAAASTEDSRKETSVPAKRGRKPSISTEPTDKIDLPEKPKAVRSRRTSRSNSEDIEQEIAQKAAPVRGRRSSASIEPDTEVKSTPKTPARATARRRSSATENTAIETVSTPAKRATRGRKASTDEIMEETKKPATRGQKKFINEEQEEVAKPITRRSRRLSSDDATTTLPPKSVERPTRHSSVNFDSEIENITSDEHVESNIIEHVSPNSLKDMNVKVTPMKKRKIIEKVEAELDLSVINESTDDMNSSNHEELESFKETIHPLKEPTEQLSGEILSENNMELPENSKNSGQVGHLTENVPNSPSGGASPTGKKRLHIGVRSDSPLRKSPRLSNMSQGELSPEKSKPSPKVSRNMQKESEGLSVDKKSFVSSGSDDSFRVHLSRISVMESVQTSSQENLQDDLLNTSKESNGSNKENLSDPINCKDVSALSLVIPLQNKILVNRVSNVFKPNQKEYSFMEPMEVDLSVIAPDESVMDKSLALDESSVIFNRKPKPFADASSGQEDEALEESTAAIHNEITVNVSIEQSASTSFTDPQIQDTLEKKNSQIRSMTDAELNDDFVVEETKNSVNICLNRNSHPEISQNDDALRPTQKSKSKSPNPHHSQENNFILVQRKSRSLSPASRSSNNVIETSSNKINPSGNLENTPRANSETSRETKRLSRSPSFFPISDPNHDCSPICGNRASRSISRSPLNQLEKTSHSPNVDGNRVDQSFEKPKGSEEVFITSEKISLDTSKDAEEMNEEMPVAKFAINNDVTRLGVKHSDSTHYDFDLPSDDGDDLLDSPKGNTSSNSMNISNPRAKSSEAESVGQTEALKIKSGDIVELRSENSKLSSKSIEAEHDVSESDVDDVFEENQATNDSMDLPLLDSADIAKADASTSRPNDSLQVEVLVEDLKIGVQKNTQPPLDEEIVMEQSGVLADFHSENQIEHSDEHDVINNKSHASFCQNSIIIDKENAEGDNALSDNEDDLPKAEDKDSIPKESNTEDIEYGKVVKKKEEKLERSNIIDEIEENADHQTKEHPSKTEPVKLNKTTENVSVCQSAEKVKKLDSRRTKMNTSRTEDSVAIKCRPSLDAFATAKLIDYLKSKAEEVESSSEDFESTGQDEEKSESEHNYREFIDGMAEEGEEDTPSEDSNNLIDEGESIGFSDSNYDGSEDDYDEDDSFICNEESKELSSEEYDLDIEKKKRPEKSRIIDPNTLGDEDIIIIPKKQTIKDKPKKRSRIITITDSSSDEELGMEIETELPKKSGINEGISQNSEIEDEGSKDIENDENRIGETSLGEDDNKDETSETDESNRKTIYNDSKRGETSKDVSLSALGTSLQRENRRSSLSIQENIKVDSPNNSTVTKRISDLVESFCSTVQKGEIAINLFLEYKDLQEPSSTKESDKAGSINILSDVKICSGVASDDERNMQITEKKETVKELHCSVVNESENSLNKKGLKRRLSKSMSEAYEEDKKAKKRKKNKRNKKFASEEKLFGESDKFSKKNQRSHDLAEDLKATSLSLMSQLITDVKNRPRRVVKPSMTSSIADCSWIATKVQNLKPSTSPASREEKRRIVPKLHPKDFKNQMLSDAKRVKRVETKTLLKKRGAFL